MYLNPLTRLVGPARSALEIARAQLNDFVEPPDVEPDPEPEPELSHDELVALLEARAAEGPNAYARLRGWHANRPDAQLPIPETSTAARRRNEWI